MTPAPSLIVAGALVAAGIVTPGALAPAGLAEISPYADARAVAARPLDGAAVQAALVSDNAIALNWTVVTFHRPPGAAWRVRVVDGPKSAGSGVKEVSLASAPGGCPGLAEALAGLSRAWSGYATEDGGPPRATDQPFYEVWSPDGGPPPAQRPDARPPAARLYALLTTMRRCTGA